MKATIGVEFANKSIEIDKHIIRAQIWDTAGQERFRAITNAYYRGAVGAMLVYDITDRGSFSRLQYWYDEMKNSSDPSIVAMLVGNKCDLEDQRQVSKEEGIEFAEKHNMAYIETSAKNSTGVVEAFKSLISRIYELLQHSAIQSDKKKLTISGISSVPSVNEFSGSKSSAEGQETRKTVNLNDQRKKKNAQKECGC